MEIEKPIYLADSIQKLAGNAEAIEIDKTFKIYLYYSTCNNLIKQASIYKTEGDIEKAYIYLLRFCILALEKLPTHPEYNDVKFTKYRDSLKKDAYDKLSELEKLKGNLVKRYRQIEVDKELESKKKFEQEKRRIEETNRVAIEKRIKEDNDRVAKQEKHENDELEREIQKIHLATTEAEQFQKKKQDYEKKLRVSRFQKQAELLREEARREQELELQKKLDLEKEQQLLHQQQVQFNENLTKDDSISILDKVTLSDNEFQKSENNDINTLNIDSDELLKYLENSKIENNKINSINNSSNNSDLLVDIPELQPKSISVTSPQINNNTNNTDNNSNIPVSYGGYPSFQQLQQQTNQYNSPPSYISSPQQQTNQYKPPPPYISSPHQQPPVPSPPQYPINNVNNNNRTPQIPQQSYFSNQIPMLPPQYQQPNQFKSPTLPVHLNQQQQQPQLPVGMKLPSTPTFGNNNLISLPPQYQQPQQMKQSPPVNTSNSNSYLANLQKPTIQNNTSLPVSVVGGSGNSQQQSSQPQPPNPVQKPKANIDSPEASKKYSKLRKIIINGELLNDFMRLADHNTRNSIETCGILSGTLSNDIFKVTTLIIPKQEGTSDTCNTVDEHEIFEYQIENDLLTLGWIHTHPTQDCFLSAVDVHTHCSYQYLLPEAVAIVMSPRANPNFGIFRLTDPPGIQTVQKCKLKSFHPHPPVNGIPIYAKAEHFDLVWGKGDSKAVDLRKKK